MAATKEMAAIQPNNVCIDCGKYWGFASNLALTGLKIGMCDVCRDFKPNAVTNPINFGYLKKGWDK